MCVHVGTHGFRMHVDSKLGINHFAHSREISAKSCTLGTNRWEQCLLEAGSLEQLMDPKVHAPSWLRHLQHPRSCQDVCWINFRINVQRIRTSSGSSLERMKSLCHSESGWFVAQIEATCGPWPEITEEPRLERNAADKELSHTCTSSKHRSWGM